MKLGDTVVELGDLVYAQKTNEWIVKIYFVGIKEPLSIFCSEEQTDHTKCAGNP